MMDDHYLAIREWTPNFQPARESIDKVAARVCGPLGWPDGPQADVGLGHKMCCWAGLDRVGSIDSSTCNHALTTTRCGAIIRSEDGRWVVGFSMNLGLCTAFVVELWGPWEGLQLAHGMGVRKLEVNLDLQSVV